MTRGIGFEEFKDRANARGFNPRNVTAIWSWLAEHLEGYERQGRPLTDCVIPLETLLNFTPAMAEKADGVGPALFEVYKFVHRSFVNDPSPLPDHDEEVTRENLAKFASNVHARTVTAAWNEFRRAMGGLAEEHPLIDQLELFCARMEDSDNWSSTFKAAYDQLLRDWLNSLKSRRGK